MPLEKDPQGGGTNGDGSRSTEYCSLCYANGEFVGGDVDVKTFQKVCYEGMLKKGIWKPLAWFWTLYIPQLKRWKRK